MIKILTIPEKEKSIREIIDGEYRLNELVSVVTNGITADIYVDDKIIVLPDWANRQPPVLFPNSDFTAENLSGIVYAKLGNYEKAGSLLDNNNGLLAVADLLHRLQNGIEAGWQRGNDYISLHNRAVAAHYSCLQMPEDITVLRQYYDRAIAAATEPEEKAFTVKHYSLLLIDAGLLHEAEAILLPQLNEAVSKAAIIGIKVTLCIVWMKQLVVPYNEELLAKLKDYLWQCLEFYEAEDRDIDAAMVLSEAAYIANISNSFSEALGYINRAIAFFEKEQLNEMLGDALMKKGNILRRWAQHNNPQFFQQAVKSYQKALDIYTRDVAPSLFAEIHHQLGIIYSEIPDEVKKKSVWAGVSVSSFNEALNFFNKVDYPYEFAVICNSFGNAYTKYPLALHSDNFDKALSWYREALDVQAKEIYPLERSLTLLNYLDASWFAGNKSDFDEDRYQDMLQKAREILALTHEPSLLRSAKEHLENLAVLKAGINTAAET